MRKVSNQMPREEREKGRSLQKRAAQNLANGQSAQTVLDHHPAKESRARRCLAIAIVLLRVPFVCLISRASATAIVHREELGSGGAIMAQCIIHRARRGSLSLYI